MPTQLKFVLRSLVYYRLGESDDYGTGNKRLLEAFFELLVQPEAAKLVRAVLPWYYLQCQVVTYLKLRGDSYRSPETTN